ncbi:MAG TPA: hypothetical protein VHF25_00215 [Nitriliruptorales bacterium]|nr:hypothetical protein [Nitriliruptorales bacterium]
MAYPESLRGNRNGGFCCGPAPAEGIQGVDDLNGVIDALIHDARIYLAGVSNGAVMGYRFVCDQATGIAGIASVAGAMVPDECRPTKAFSVLEITTPPTTWCRGGELADFTHGTRPAASSVEVVQFWAAMNGCPQPTSRTEGRVTTTGWRGCRDDTSVSLVTIEGAGPTWYASEFGPIQGALNAPATIIDFFNLSRRP